jgi:hypothetical protein
MTSKKLASSKRATPPRAADYAKAFQKDWERLSRSGRYDMKRLKEAMLLLIANDAPYFVQPMRDLLEQLSQKIGDGTPTCL